MPLTTLADRALLRMYADVMRELRRRGAVTSWNNPVGDVAVAERLAAQAFALQLAPKSGKGFDGEDAAGTKYQVKGRRLTPDNPSTELSVIRGLAERHFDYLIAIYFDENFEIHEAFKVAHDVVARHCAFAAHTNGHRFALTRSIRLDPGCVDVSDQVRSVWGAAAP